MTSDVYGTMYGEFDSTQSMIESILMILLLTRPCKTIENASGASIGAATTVAVA